MDTISLSGILLIALVLLMISSFISVLVMNNVRPTAFIQLLPNQGSLASPVKVGTIDQLRSEFFTAPGSTFSCYLYVSLATKTQTLTKDPIPVVQFGKSVQFQILPGGVSTKPRAQLAVLTQGSTIQTETIDVESFPMQQWVWFAITREGRRYTIYYNGQAVSSDRTTYFPVVSSSTLTLGDERLRGEFAFPRVVGSVLERSELAAYKQATSDSRNVPYTKGGSIFSDLYQIITSPFLCPNGIFCFSTSGLPTQDPTQSWKSAYA